MRTEENLADLEAELAANCGSFFDACRTVGLSPMFVRKWIKDDPQVAERLGEAERCGALRLESAAIDRAVNGVTEEIYFQGGVVGEKKVYSDGLLTTLLKGRLSDTYGANADGNRVQINLTNAIQVMPRANSYEEWLQMARATDAPALPAPLQQIELAELTPVIPPEDDPAMADIL